MTRKIAMISEHASPLAALGGVDTGGQNVYVAHLARQLAKLGHEVDIFTRRDLKNQAQIVQWEDGIRVIHVPAGPPEFIQKERLLCHMDNFTHFMIRFINQQDQPYDIIHANFWMSGLVAADLKRDLAIPFVVTFHALGRVRRIYQGKEDGFPDRRFEVEDRIVAEADGIIAECPQDETDLIEYYHADPAKIVIVPCGFDPEELWPIEKSAARKLLKLPQKEKVVLQLGRIVPRKGVDNVIRGFAQFMRENEVRARLVIVGGESDKPDARTTPEIGRLQQIAIDEGIANRVQFVGRKDRQSLKYYYSAADIFVTTPWYEPFGITPLEAMACGTPVIGAEVGGIKYTVVDGQTGCLVPTNDPQALASRMAELLPDPEKLAEMSRLGIERVNNQFTWVKVARMIAAIYEKVIAASQPQVFAQTHHFGIVQRNFGALINTLKRSQKTLGTHILEASQAISVALARGNKVLVCGNGGSAADAQHFAGEFVGRFKYSDRGAIPAISLTTDTSIITAWANDVCFTNIFARQVEALGQPGDVLVGISTSGRSQNIIDAFDAAQQRGINRIAMVGGDGGELRTKADLSIIVPSFDTQRIQEVQILILHMIVEIVEEQWVGRGSLNQTALATQDAWNLQKNTPISVTFDKTE